LEIIYAHFKTERVTKIYTTADPMEYIARGVLLFMTTASMHPVLEVQSATAAKNV